MTTLQRFREQKYLKQQNTKSKKRNSQTENTFNTCLNELMPEEYINYFS